MKIGFAISAAILLIVGGALFMKFQPSPADKPSGQVTEANLAKQTLKKGLPDLGIKPGGSGTVGSLFSAIQGAQGFMRAGGYDEEALEASAEVVAALKAVGKPGKGFLDGRIPDKRFESPELKRSLQVLGSAVRMQVDLHLEDFKTKPAREIALAYLAFGKASFENNTRLKSRQRGLAMMRSALSTLGRVNRELYDDEQIDNEELQEMNAELMAWNDAIKAIEDVWNAKLKSIETVKQEDNIPNIADLVKIANEDKDPTFRNFAALRLGYALFERGDEGNQAAINKALDELEAGADKAVAAAAKTGRSIKDRDEYYELRK